MTNGLTTAWSSNTWAFDAAYDLFTLDLGGGPLGEIEAWGLELASGIRGVEIRVWDDNGDGAEDELTFLLRITGDGVTDAFIDTTSAADFVQPAPVGGSVNHEMTISFPATSSSVLAVAAYTTRSDWTDAQGNSWSFGAPVNALASFSSRGPGRAPSLTGLLPDLAAPGQRLISALNVHSDATEADLTDVVIGGVGMAQSYVASQHASMASPMVTGALALALHLAPSLDDAGARAALQDGAWGDIHTGALPNLDFGAGKLDAHATTALAAGLQPAGHGGSPCGGAPASLVESEPNDSMYWNSLVSFDGALTVTISSIACGNDGSDWTGDRD